MGNCYQISRIGKLPEAKQLVEEYSQILHQAKFIELAITTVHALRAGSLPIAHRDPFDRMIMAQAELENLPVITYDAAFQTGLIQVIAVINNLSSTNSSTSTVCRVCNWLR